MGGPSSGWRRQKRGTVEGCHSLGVGDIGRFNHLAEVQSGVLKWGTGYEVGFSIRRLNPGSAVLSLRYAHLSPMGIRTSVEDRIFLDVMTSKTGRVRWVFRCPLRVSGGICSRRTFKLYCPPDSGHFGCRQCHRLTYRSCQTGLSRSDQSKHDRRVGLSLLRDLGLWRRLSKVILVE